MVKLLLFMTIRYTGKGWNLIGVFLALWKRITKDTFRYRHQWPHALDNMKKLNIDPASLKKFSSPMITGIIRAGSMIF